jgi:hypothetical protein
MLWPHSLIPFVIAMVEVVGWRGGYQPNVGDMLSFALVSSSSEPRRAALPDLLVSCSTSLTSFRILLSRVHECRRALRAADHNGLR